MIDPGYIYKDMSIKTNLPKILPNIFKLCVLLTKITTRIGIFCFYQNLIFIFAAYEAVISRCQCIIYLPHDGSYQCCIQLTLSEWNVDN